MPRKPGKAQSKNRLAYFDVTGELLLEFLREKSDLPADVSLIRVYETPPNYYPRNEKMGNMLRFIVASETYDMVMEGAMFPQIEPRCRKNNG